MRNRKYICPYDLFSGKVEKGTIYYAKDNSMIKKAIYYPEMEEGGEYSLPGEIVEKWEKDPSFINALEYQRELLETIREQEINIVTCGNCGQALLHKMEEESVKCIECEKNMDLSDCPDLLWNLHSYRKDYL